MGDGSPAGGENPPNTTPIANNGFFSTILGRTTQDAAPVEDRMADAKTMAEIVGILNGLTTTGADISGGQFTGLTGPSAANPMSQDPAQQAQAATTTSGIASLAALNAGIQAQRDAITSANSPTTTGGKANSPSTGGLASLGVNPDFAARQDEADAAVTAFNTAAAPAAPIDKDQAIAIGFQDAERDREAAAKENAALASPSFTTPAPTVTAGGMYVDAKNAAAAQAMQNANAATIAGFGVDPFSSDSGSARGGEGDGGGGARGGSDQGATGGGYQAKGGMVGRYAQGGLGSLGGYSDGGRLLRGPGDGVSDSIPATVGNRQPARLADGEFVVPARIVSELGNGSTEAGARALYKMMDRIQANRRKTTGKNRVAVNSKSHKYLPA